MDTSFGLDVDYHQAFILHSVVKEIEDMLERFAPNLLVFGDYVLSVVFPRFRNKDIEPFEHLDIWIPSTQFGNPTNYLDDFLNTMNASLRKIQTTNSAVKQYYLVKDNFKIALINIHDTHPKDIPDFTGPSYYCQKIFGFPSESNVTRMQLSLKLEHLKLLSTADEKTLAVHRKKFEKLSRRGWSICVCGGLSVLHSWGEIMEYVENFKKALHTDDNNLVVGNKHKDVNAELVLTKTKLESMRVELKLTKDELKSTKEELIATKAQLLKIGEFLKDIKILQS